MMKTKFFTKMVVVLSLIAFAGLANAVPLIISSPSSPTSLPGTSLASDPHLAGTVVVDEIAPFSFSAYGGVVSGTVQVRVVWADDYTYNFYWRITNDILSDGAIEEFRMGDFFNTTIYDGDYRIDGLGDIGPDSGRVFTDPATGIPDEFVNFKFSSSGLAPGQESKFFFLDTDATNFARTLSYDLTSIGASSNSIVYSGYAPVPGSVAPDAVIGDGAKIKKGVTVVSGAEIGINVILNKNSTVGPNTIVEDYTSLSTNVTINNDAVIGKNVRIRKNVMIGARVTIGDHAVIKKGTVIKDDATIGMNVTLGKNVTVLESVNIPDGENIPNGTVVMQ
jgi:acetyltransferase-like isoleucine patch superfamily enzyme